MGLRAILDGREAPLGINQSITPIIFTTRERLGCVLS